MASPRSVSFCRQSSRACDRLSVPCGRADLLDHGGDVIQRIAPASEQMGKVGITDIARAENAVPGDGVTRGHDDPDSFPVAQGRRSDTELMGKLTDGTGGTLRRRRRTGLGLHRQVIHRFPHRLQGLPVTEQLTMPPIDDRQSLVELAPVHRVHDLAATA